MRPQRFLAFALVTSTTACALVLELDDVRFDGARGPSSGGGADASADGSLDSATDPVDRVEPTQSTLIASGLWEPRGIAVSGSSLYFAEVGGQGNVRRCSLDGCDGGVVPGSTYASGLVAADDASVYFATELKFSQGEEILFVCDWSTCDDAGPVTLEQAFSPLAMKDSPSGGVAFAGLQFGVGAFAELFEPGAKKKFRVMTSTSVDSIAASPSHLAFASAGAIYTCETSGKTCDPDGGNAPLVVVGDGGSPIPSMVVSNDTVYWISPERSEIDMCAAGGCKQPTALREGIDHATVLTTDGTSLYWIRNTGIAREGAILKCTLPACSASEKVIVDLVDPAFLAVDATSVYWTEAGFGQVNRGEVRKTSK